MLLALTTGQRVQTLALIELENIRTTSQGIEIKISKRVKTSGVNKFQPLLVLPFYQDDSNICVASTMLLFYIEVTSFLRNNLCKHLLITFKKPHHDASSQTISRWIRRVMIKAGVDTSIFGTHSTRHAATSSANRKGVPFDVIRLAAGWSEQSKVFAKFYNRPLRDHSSFARAVLNN